MKWSQFQEWALGRLGVRVAHAVCYAILTNSTGIRIEGAA